MKPEISILMPGIRPDRWTSVYNSILESTKREFELIIVGPYALPKELQEAKNVRFNSKLNQNHSNHSDPNLRGEYNAARSDLESSPVYSETVYVKILSVGTITLFLVCKI